MLGKVNCIFQPLKVDHVAQYAVYPSHEVEFAVLIQGSGNLPFWQFFTSHLRYV